MPSKIRDIVTKSISGSEHKMSTGTLADERRALENEVNRLEDLLSSTRAERDEISSKYLAVSERVSMKVNVKAATFCTLFTLRAILCVIHVFT